ncbi:MAG: aminotransferase class I/II-fold pyridoxal phosphate-dependent enzyme [Pseudomonadota bacterium]
MRISERLGGVVPGGDDGWGVYYRARALKAAGERVVELTIGEHDIATDGAILDAMDRAGRGGATGYPAVPGLPPLRRAVAEWVATRTGMATALANVLIVPGGQAGLYAAHLCALEPGDTGLIADPYYATYPGTIRAAGGAVRMVPTRADDGFAPRGAAILDAASTAQAEGRRAGSLLINTPNNPTGAVYSRSALAEIASAVTEADLWLISDEVYDGQVWEGVHVSPRALPGMAERTLVVGSMSKSFAMTGSRLGWIVGPEPAIAALANLATHTTYGVAGFVQHAAYWALTEGGAALEARVAAPFERRRALVAEALGGTAALHVRPMQGGMYAFVDISATGLSGTAFAERLLAAERIAVMPGESFGAAGVGHIRIALTAPDAEMTDALQRIVAFAEARVGERTAAE